MVQNCWVQILGLWDWNFEFRVEGLGSGSRGLSSGVGEFSV